MIFATPQSVPENREVSETLNNLGCFWVGADLEICDSIILEPHKEAFLTFYLKPQNLPPITLQKPLLQQLVSLLQISLRSRIAQVGLEIVSPIEVLSEEDHQLQGRVRVKTIGNCPLAISKGHRFACFYHPAGAELLVGKKLKEEIGKGLKIDGEKGKGWNFFRIENIGHKRHTHGVLLKINPARRWQVGDCPNPITILNPDIVDFRKDLEEKRLLVSITSTTDLAFWVGETEASIHIPTGYNGILSNQVYDGEGNQLGFIQTESNLIRGGETDWPIRTEFMIPDGTPMGLLRDGEIFIALILFRDRTNG